MSFNLNKLGDMLLKVGTSTLQTASFGVAAKALNSPCNGGVSIFGGGCCGYPGGMGMGMGMNIPISMSIGGYGCPSPLGMGMYPMMSPGMNPYQMAQYSAQVDMLIASLETRNQNFNNFLNPQLQTSVNPAAEKFSEHNTALGQIFDENTKNGKTTQFTTSDWSKMSEGAEKDKKYTEQASNIAKSYVAYMDQKSGNKDNEITLQEYVKHNMDSDLKEDATQEEIEAYKEIATTSFNKIDQNHDGKIDWKEMGSLFGTFDAAKDGKRDGKITKEEMEQGYIGLTNQNSTAIDTALKTEYRRLFGSNQ